MRTKRDQLIEAVHIAKVMLHDARNNGASQDRVAVLRDRLDNAKANLREHRAED